MAYCSNCGKEVNNVAMFCQHCGVRRGSAAPIPVQPVELPAPPMIFDGELPFTLDQDEHLAMVAENTQYKTGSVYTSCNTFLTDRQLVFAKKNGSSIIAKFPLEKLEGIDGGKNMQGNNIRFSIQGFQGTQDVIVIYVAKLYGENRLRGVERDWMIARIKELQEDRIIANQQSMVEPPEPKTVTAPPPTILDEDAKSSKVTDKEIMDVSSLIATTKDVIPDYLEKEWAKAVRDHDDAAMVAAFSKIQPLIVEYAKRIKSQEYNEGEEDQWVNEISNGVFKRNVVERWVITNQRAFILRAGSDGILKRTSGVGLAIANAVVMNQYRKSNSTHVGTFVSRKGFGVGGGRSTSTSTSYGDLVFMSDGKEILRFPGISDPNGVKKMVEALKKQIRI